MLEVILCDRCNSLDTVAMILHQKGQRQWLISICPADGMGVAAILEAV